MYGGGGVDDLALNLRLGHKRKWAVDMQGLVRASGLSLGAGTPGEGELSDTASELQGISLDAADEVYFMLDPLDWDIDLARDIQAAVAFTLVTGTQTGIIFTLDMKGVANGQALGDCKVTPDATKIFPTLAANGVSNSINKTALASMGVPGTFAADDVIACALTMTNIGTAAADAIKLLYVEFVYTLKLTNALGRPLRT